MGQHSLLVNWGESDCRLVFSRADGECRSLPLSRADVGLEVGEIDRDGGGGEGGVVRTTELSCPGMLETLGGTQSATADVCGGGGVTTLNFNCCNLQFERKGRLFRGYGLTYSG